MKPIKFSHSSKDLPKPSSDALEWQMVSFIPDRHVMLKANCDYYIDVEHAIMGENGDLLGLPLVERITGDHVCDLMRTVESNDNNG